MKKSVFVLFLLICVVFVSASFDVSLDLTKTSYSNNENFQGNLIINETSVDISDLVEGDVSECGNYDKVSVSLYTLLSNAGIYTGDELVYSLGTYSIDMQESFEVNETKSIAFWVEEEVDKINFSLSGSGTGFYIDVGLDGEDWHYVGAFSEWSDIIYSNEYDASYSLAGADSRDPKYEECNSFELEFDELSTELLVEVNGKARRDVDTGKLVVSIGNSEECDITDQIAVSGSWSDFSCEIVLGVGGEDSPNNFSVCVDSSTTGYEIPVAPNSDYFFFNLKKAKYQESLGSEGVYIGSSLLEELINDYTGKCYSGDCIVPVGLRLESGGGVILEDLTLEYGPTTSRNFYELETETVYVDLSDETIPLASFSELKTPEVDEAEICILELSFAGEDMEVSFNVSPGPTAVIGVSSYYMGKNLDIQFDGGDSLAQGNKSISKWKWKFGDNKTGLGEVVSHKYSVDGDYTVELTVKDSEGIESSTSVVVHIVPLEDYLELEFSRVDSLFIDSSAFFEDLDGVLGEFSSFMGYSALINSSEISVGVLESNFTSVRDSESTTKEKKYGVIASELHSLFSKTPLEVGKLNSLVIKRVSLDSPSEVFRFSGVSNRSNFNAYANAIYSFNRDNVVVDMNSTLFDVDFFEGKSSYVFVRKEIDVTGGSNVIIAEDISGLVSNLDNVVASGQKDDSAKVIYWIGNVGEIKYAVPVSGLEEIKTVVYSDVSVDSIPYCYTYSEGCEKYCGDNSCETWERVEGGDDYCAEDCARANSIWKYIFLFGGFFLLILYLLVYRGPGNFRDLTNKIAYSLFHKKLFVGEKDKVILSSFIISSLRRGFSKEQIISALVHKGWSKSQIELLFETFIRK
ncbi:PKD domain-containing protein [archaeon]|nr:PKD domain-containing protein [archaeon]